MKTLILVLIGFALMTPALADSPRDAALRDCNVASIKRYSYSGSQYDKEQQRYDFYRACMNNHGQVP
jgi:hypothetical protein